MKCLGLFFVFFLFVLKVSAFPENVRYGYFNCTACHVSPSGGGVLTPYGRSLSAELMSTWGSPKTAGFLFSDNEDEKRNPPWFRANIFLRGVQTWRNSPSVEKAQFIPMQGDIEGGVDTEKYAIIATLGFRAENSSKSKELNEFFSRRFYALYRFDENWAVRAGKYMFSFGLNGPDHVTATRRGLGWDQGSEGYNLELSYIGEKASTIVTVVGDAPEEKNQKKDKGLAFNQSFFFGEDSRLGISGFLGSQSDFDRTVVGPYWIWSLTKKMFLDSEIFFQQKNIRSTDKHINGYANFNRLGYEAVKGLIIFVQFDRSYLDTSDESSRYDSYGPGIQWLPYPHFELMGYLGKEKSYGQDSTDFAWLMLHIYL